MKGNIKENNHLLQVLILGLLFALIYMMPAFVQKAEASTVGVTGVKVHTFDVGSGSCAIVEFELNTGGSSYTMVDAGSGYKTTDAEYKETLSDIQDFITQKGITAFKYVILSHYDSDHTKMLDDLIGSSKIQVGQFVCKTYSKTLPALRAAKDADLTPMITYYDKVRSVIAKKKSQGKLSNAEILSPSSGDLLTVGNYVQENGKYTAVKVSLRFFNKSGSHFSGLYTLGSNNKVTFTNKNMYDWRAASNNDSLVFVMRYYDPSAYGDSSRVKKILFCGDILSTAMTEFIGKSYEYDADADKVVSTAAPTDVSNTFQKYASDCDLVAGWPHHGKILGAELRENESETAFTDDWRTSYMIREDFTNLVAKEQNQTVCFVSTKTTETIKEKADKWNSGQWEIDQGTEAFDIPSLVKFKDGGYYTNCITGGHALLSKFDVMAETQTIYACKSTATKYNERLINTTDKTYYDFNYVFK